MIKIQGSILSLYIAAICAHTHQHQHRDSLCCSTFFLQKYSTSYHTYQVRTFNLFLSTPSRFGLFACLGRSMAACY